MKHKQRGTKMKSQPGASRAYAHGKTTANHDIRNIIFVDTIESTLCKYIHRIYI